MTSNTIKVFAGNLPFSVNDEQLKAMFAPAGNVVSATVIYRGTRSLGYGFVEMDNEASAKKAVDMMNKSTVDSRQINVEVARPRAPGDTAPRGGAGGAGAGGVGEDGAARGRRRRTRGRGPRADGSAGGADGGASGGGAQSGQQNRAPAVPRADRVQSQTTVFVANLPFTVDNAALLAAFKNVKAIDAQVSMRRGGRSKGFGFVLFANNADQQKAIAAMDGKTIGDREVAVKAALTEFAVEKLRNEQQAASDAAAGISAGGASSSSSGATSTPPRAASGAGAAAAGGAAAGGAAGGAGSRNASAKK